MAEEEKEILERIEIRIGNIENLMNQVIAGYVEVPRGRVNYRKDDIKANEHNPTI